MLSDPKRDATRLEMVEAAYNVQCTAHLIFKSDNLKFGGCNYRKVHSVLQNTLPKGYNGRNDKILDLSSACTRQELLVYTKNAYEFVVYEAGLASKGVFWEVSYNGNKVYLLGSVHYADSSTYPLSKDILNAFDASDVLAVEADLEKTEEAATYMLAKGMYQDDNTLQQNVRRSL